jgi:hypothetical protein
VKIISFFGLRDYRDLKTSGVEQRMDRGKQQTHYAHCYHCQGVVPKSASALPHVQFAVLISDTKSSHDKEPFWWSKKTELLRCLGCGRTMCYFSSIDEDDQDMDYDTGESVFQPHLEEYVWIDERVEGTCIPVVPAPQAAGPVPAPVLDPASVPDQIPAPAFAAPPHAAAADAK